jgi:predicted ATP-grasp superfamily ATP-dependent carboligase
MVANLMSKTNQVRWANEIGLKVAKSWELDLCSDGCWKQIETYPCILKPVVSSEGHKVDITKCKSEQEAKKSIKILKDKGYKRILAQEFIYKEYEMELFGCITKKSKITPYLLSKHVREWPPTAGTVSCHDFIVDKKHKIIAEDILHKIMDYGYVGNIDIELFMVAGEIYLNEVNFRNSGDIFACFRNKVYYPLIWYLDVIGEDISKYNVAYDNNKYAMNETTDFRHVVYGKLKFKDWLKYYKNCGDFAIKFKGDNGPTMARYSRIILDVLKKGRLQKELGQRN